MPTRQLEDPALRGEAAKFATEAELVCAVVRFLSAERSAAFRYIAEHEAGFGRPDLVLYNRAVTEDGDLETLCTVRPRLAPLLSPKAACRIASLEDLARATGTTPRTARSIARQLAAVRRLKWKSTTDFEILPIRHFPFRNVVAVEAKLRDWRRGLVQAYRYREFSSEAWVLLDATQTGPALKNIARFEATGVGLASYSANNELFVHIPARPSEIPDTALAWRTQTMLAKVIQKLRTH